MEWKFLFIYIFYFDGFPWRSVNVPALSSYPATTMESVKEFLNFSTIHGLVYLATNKRLVRLLWLGVVIAGFTGAGVLIYQGRFQKFQLSKLVEFNNIIFLSGQAIHHLPT